MKELIEELRQAADVKPEDCPELFEKAAEAIESQAATIARYETTAENYELLQAKVDGQAREIERLMQTFSRVADFLGIDTEAARKATGKPSDVFIAAIKAQPRGVVLPEPMKRGDEGGSGEYGAAMIRGYNACLREVSRLNSSPVSAAP